MQIETLSPVTQKRVLRFVQDLAEAFRRIQAEAKAREENQPTVKPEESHESKI